MKQNIIFKTTVNGTSGGKSIPFSQPVTTGYNIGFLDRMMDRVRQENAAHLMDKRTAWFAKMFPEITRHKRNPSIDPEEIQAGEILLLIFPGEFPRRVMFVALDGTDIVVSFNLVPPKDALEALENLYTDDVIAIPLEYHCYLTHEKR